MFVVIAAFLVAFGAPLAFLMLGGSLTQYRASTLMVAMGVLVGMPLVLVLVLLSPSLEQAMALSPNDRAGSIFDMYYLGAFPEEGLKFLASLAVISWFGARRFADVVMAPVAVAIGFALQENLLFVFYDQQMLLVALMRGVSSVPVHALCALVMGSMIVFATRAPQPVRVLYWLGAVLLPVLFHGGYNLILHLPETGGLGLSLEELGHRIFFLTTCLTGGMLLCALLLVRQARMHSGERRPRLETARMSPFAHHRQEISAGFAMVGACFLVIGGVVGGGLLAPEAITPALRAAGYFALLISLVFLDEARRWWHLGQASRLGIVKLPVAVRQRLRGGQTG